MVLRGLPDTVGCVGGYGSDSSLLQVPRELQRWEPVVVTMLICQQVAINSHTRSIRTQQRKRHLVAPHCLSLWGSSQDTE